MSTRPEANIRFGSRDDLEAIVAFQKEMALETEGKELQSQVVYEGVRAVLEDKEKGFYVVAESNDKVVASLMITQEWSDWRNTFFWWIQSVYVHPQFRRQGIFSKLHSFVEEIASNNPDVFGLRLYVESNNESAKRTYESLGMRQTDYNLYEVVF